MLLLDKGEDIPQSNEAIKQNYERFSYLRGLKIRDLQVIFLKLRQPFETDIRSNIIDYNWHVDGILKNSQSYNKLNLEKRMCENSTAKLIDVDELLPLKKEYTDLASSQKMTVLFEECGV